MRDIERLYDDELAYIRHLGIEFARDRPNMAAQLEVDLESGQSRDPHVERLIEAFAFLTARVRLKLQEEFPEITDAFLSVLYPHYLAPLPSMSVVQFELSSGQGHLTDGYDIKPLSQVYSRPVRDFGLPCRYRTVYPLTLWPLELTACQYLTAPFGKVVSPPPEADRPVSLLRLELTAPPGVTIHGLTRLDRLRFFLNGDEVTTRLLYELIFNHVTCIMLSNGAPGSPPVILGPECLEPVGFQRDEGLLPYQRRSFLGYRLLTEYFAFPQKFLFFDVRGLGATRSDRFRDRLEIFLFLKRNEQVMETRVRTETFRLGCSPIVNLFAQEADPIRLTQNRHEYLITPDVRYAQAMEVYSVDRVYSTDTATRQTVEYQPFYSFRHGQEGAGSPVYWYTQRRPSLRQGDSATEVYLALANANFQPDLPATEVLSLEVTCTNRDLPSELRVAGNAAWQFQLEGQAPVKSITPLVPPTGTIRMPFAEHRWRLISHLAMNHLSITGEEDGAEALREILKLYDMTSNKVTGQQIAGVQRVRTRRVVAPVNDEALHGFCRALQITIELDEDKYAGSGMFLFAAVLERFITLYASLNSATQLVVEHGRAPPWTWPFRVGERTLL